jgi:hypothetical protein
VYTRAQRRAALAATTTNGVPFQSSFKRSYRLERRDDESKQPDAMCDFDTLCYIRGAVVPVTIPSKRRLMQVPSDVTR